MCEQTFSFAFDTSQIFDSKRERWHVEGTKAADSESCVICVLTADMDTSNKIDNMRCTDDIIGDDIGKDEDDKHQEIAKYNTANIIHSFAVSVSVDYTDSKTFTILIINFFLVHVVWHCNDHASDFVVCVKVLMKEEVWLHIIIIKISISV